MNRSIHIFGLGGSVNCTCKYNLKCCYYFINKKSELAVRHGLSKESGVLAIGGKVT